MSLTVAVGMEQFEVVHAVRATLRTPDPVMHLLLLFFEQVLAAHQTTSLLFFP
jgi:hypothetical protein